MIFAIVDLLGVAVFAVSGALAAGRKDLDILGVIVVAAVTAIGGGTLRDILLDRHPIFWIADASYLYVILASAILTVVCARIWTPPKNALLVADALGLALFALSGAQVAEAALCPTLVVILMGTMTGVAGGILRDVITAQIPLILRQDIYAIAAIVGVVLYQVLQVGGVDRNWAFGLGMAATFLLRLLAILGNWTLPKIRLP